MPADAYSRSDTSTSDSGSNNELYGSSPPGQSSSTSSGKINNQNRERTDSESSDRQPKFILPGAAGSPPKILTMDEVHATLINVENMTLAHEIAVNPDFRLQPYEPQENSLEKQVKEIVHKAFWDNLREQLSQVPPGYDHAIQLLGEIKEDLSHIITKNNQKALDRICEVLDVTVIRQQAEQGVLDFKSYAHFIIQIMARSCAPVRDEMVAKLFEIEDIVDTFRGILETMTLMKLDMANCLLETARKDVIAHSVEYEKEKFREYKKVYTWGFPITEKWLLKHKPEDTMTNPHWIDSTILNAYVDLLDYEDNEFPETIDMDKERILELANRVRQLCICAAALIITNSLPIICQNSEHKTMIKKQLKIIMASVKNEQDLTDIIENIWLQIKSVINGRLNEQKLNEMDTETEETLKNQILLLTNKNSPIRSLLWKRLMTYARLIITKKTIPPSALPGFTDFTDDLEMFIAFRRIAFYNYSVFGDYYREILTSPPKSSEIESSSSSTIPPSQNTVSTTTAVTTATTSTSTSSSSSSSVQD